MQREPAHEQDILCSSTPNFVVTLTDLLLKGNSYWQIMRHETCMINTKIVIFIEILIGQSFKWTEIYFWRLLVQIKCQCSAELQENRHSHTKSRIPPVAANCVCWGAECWCMHILSHTAVKLPVKRPEVQCSQALVASLAHQNALTRKSPLIKK